MYDDDFNKFWFSYPRRRNKEVAYGVWKRTTKDYPPADLILSAERYQDACDEQRTEERFIMHPATFLAKGRWKEYHLVEEGA